MPPGPTPAEGPPDRAAKAASPGHRRDPRRSPAAETPWRSRGTVGSNAHPAAHRGCRATCSAPSSRCASPSWPGPWRCSSSPALVLGPVVGGALRPARPASPHSPGRSGRATGATGCTPTARTPSWESTAQAFDEMLDSVEGAEQQALAAERAPTRLPLRRRPRAAHPARRLAGGRPSTCCGPTRPGSERERDPRHAAARVAARRAARRRHAAHGPDRQRPAARTTALST